MHIMSLEVNVCSVTDLLVGTRYTPHATKPAWKKANNHARDRWESGGQGYSGLSPY